MTEIADKGRAAKMLLADETFQGVMADIRAGTLEAWKNTRSGEGELREKLWLDIHAIDAIEAELSHRVEAAEIEERTATRRK